MNIIDLATKTLQLAIQTAVDGVKTVVDAIKTTTDATKKTVDSTKSVVDATKTNVDALLAGRVIKSIQKGIVTTGAINSQEYLITIAPINANKAFVLLNGEKDTGYGGSYPVVLKTLTSTQLVVKPTVNDINYGYDFSWQIIEFY